MSKNKKQKCPSEPITHVPILKSTKPISDGSFIESTDMNDGYGEEIDVDDM